MGYFITYKMQRKQYSNYKLQVALYRGEYQMKGKIYSQGF